VAEPQFVAPAQVYKNLVTVSVGKANLSVGKMILLGVLAGCYIGFGAHLCTTVTTGWAGQFFGLCKFFGGAVFSVGLMLVVIAGAELFTGNCLMPLGLLERKITWGGMLKNWVIVWVANLAGSILLAWMIAGMSGLNNGPIGTTAINIAGGKCALTSMQIFFRGILANWLVCLAVVLALTSTDIVGKVFGVFFPIMAFVAMGFEHSVANMYFIPAGLFTKAFEAATTGATQSALDALTMANTVRNIIWATIGNIVGGGGFVALIYWASYVKGSEQK